MVCIEDTIPEQGKGRREEGRRVERKEGGKKGREEGRMAEERNEDGKEE